MVENAEDVPGETKPNFVEFFGDVKPPKIEAKPNIDGVSVHVEASKYVDSGILPLQAHEVDTTRFFSDDVKSKDREELLEWARRQANKEGFTIVTQRSSLINPMFQLVCERSGAHKVPEKKKTEACDNGLKKMCILDYKYPLGKKDGKEVSNRNVVKKIMRAWKVMVESPTQELYANALVELQDVCSDFPLFLKYAMTTLNEVKEKIVRAWTDHVLHLGCRTTNRVESAHALVKKYLDNSVGDLGTCWEKIHDMLLLQFTAIQTTFGQSVILFEHRFKDVTLYSGLGGHVSRYALDNIALEESRCRETLCMDKEICGCVQRTSYWLPCVSKIATKILEEKPNLLDEIHHHWHRLRMGEESNEVGFSVDDELKGIVERLMKLPFQMKLEVKEGLRQLAFPETTMMSPPPRNVPTKGAKKKVDIARSKGKITSTSRIPSSWEVVDSQNPDSELSPSPTTSSYKRKKCARLGKTSLSPLPPPSRYPKPEAIPVMRHIDYMPHFMLPFIEKVVDVIGDGHCGFRAIAEFMGLTGKKSNHDSYTSYSRVERS
ncbi:hypothetical protein MTR_2g030885 [Medicago truncatula]|uniref:OTU domain-containing protein n=1 Tax=Medicago truncatula TaxID=3880 RepID=A0A072V6T5_MEDTR|nr:hypothetical protein MTR_2g030885 [Medicago truncatula]